MHRQFPTIEIHEAPDGDQKRLRAVDHDGTPHAVNKHDWANKDGIEGKWEDVIEAIVRDELELGAVEFDEELLVDVDRAVRHVANSDLIDGKQQQKKARIIIEYLHQEDILDSENDQLIVLKEPDDDESISMEMALNWASCLSTITGMIDDVVTDLESRQEDLQQASDKIDFAQTDVKRMFARRQKTLRKLGEDPTEIPEPEYVREGGDKTILEIGVPDEIDDENSQLYKETFADALYQHRRITGGQLPIPSDSLSQLEKELGRQVSRIEEYAGDLEEQELIYRYLTVFLDTVEDETNDEVIEFIQQVVGKMRNMSEVAEMDTDEAVSVLEDPEFRLDNDVDPFGDIDVDVDELEDADESQKEDFVADLVQNPDEGES